MKEQLMLGKRFADDGIPLLQLNDLQIEMKEAINLKIRDNIYQFETVECCVCQRTEFDSLASKDRYGLHMSVVICKKCGMIQTNPRMTEESYRDFYNDEYRKLYTGVETPTEEFFKFQRWRGKKISNYLQEHGSIKGPLDEVRVLEIGCGAGGVLHYFRELGCQVKGVDLGQDYVDYGKTKYDLDLSTGSIFDIDPELQFDLIIYSHVLEHILSPNENMKKTHELLNETGVIYLEVPGINYIHKSYDVDFLKYLQNAHVYHFSLSTLNNLLERNGFDLNIGDEVIRSIYAKQSSQKSAQSINSDYTAAIKYLKRLPYHPYKIIDLPRRNAIKLMRLLGLYSITRRIYRTLIGRD